VAGSPATLFLNSKPSAINAVAMQHSCPAAG
jgi:hypothetical protein